MVDLLNEKRQGPQKQESPQSQSHPSPHGGIPPTPGPARPPARGKVPRDRHCWKPTWPIPPIPMRLLCFGFMAACLGWASCAFSRPAARTCGVGGGDAGRAPVVNVTHVPEVTIAVMGATGSGKTTFVNLLSKSDLDVGKGLRSCTKSVQPAETFELDGRRVALIDTPGFDDTSLSDTDVLNMIAAFLASSYEEGKKLAGVLYFHRITDPKMTGMSKRNFGMFRKLCGDNALQNVVIVTNMWGQVELQVGEDREAELTGEDDFFKPVLDKGAQMERHHNTVASAEKIIRLILDRNPLPLRIQKELVDEHKALPDTDAGEELNKELNRQIKKYQEEMRSLVEDMEQASRDKDEETRRELEMVIWKLETKIDGLQDDGRRMASDYDRKLNALRAAFRSNADASEEEKARLRKELSSLHDRIHRGFFSKIAARLDGIDL